MTSTANHKKAAMPLKNRKQLQRRHMPKLPTALITAALLGALGFTPSCHAEEVGEKEKTIVPSGYKLVWSDEFSGSGLPDPKKWNYDTSGNKERRPVWNSSGSSASTRNWLNMKSASGIYVESR